MLASVMRRLTVATTPARLNGIRNIGNDTGRRYKTIEDVRPSSHNKNGQAWLPFEGSLCQLHPVHSTRHMDVRQQKLVAIYVQESVGLIGIVSLVNLETCIGQNLNQKLPHKTFIFDD